MHYIGRNTHLFKYVIIAVFFTASLLIASNSSAESKIPKVRHSVKPLDLSRTPTTEELMAAGQLGGQLYPTEDIDIADGVVPQNGKAMKSMAMKDPKKLKRDKEINLSFGSAIDEWNRHEYKKAVKMFRKHAEDYPDSPWADESLLHVGCDARYNGRYTEAEEMFSTIIDKNKDSDHYGAKMLRNKARSRLAILKLLKGNPDEATNLLGMLKKDSPDWRDRTYAAHWIQRISGYKIDELALLNCGAEALAHILKKEGRKEEAIQVLDIRPSTLKGHSIEDLKSMAEQYGYSVNGLKLVTADLQNIPLPAIVQIEGRKEGESGHYWILEKINNDDLKLFDPQSGGRFSQSSGEFSREWSGNAIVFSDEKTLPGVALKEDEMKQIYGGCCGVKMAEGFLGDPGERSKTACGAPVWDVNMVNMNFYATDIPLWYNPPIGPSVYIKLSYNSLSSTAYNEPFGNKWQFNYGSYLVVDTGGTVTIFMPDGRRDVYSPDGSGGYDRPFNIYNDLTKIAANHFELRFPDDTVYIYNIPPGTSSLQPFLIEIQDAYGQSLTFTYNTSIQLATITDAMGRDTTLNYNGQGLVDQVSDPFGRSAYFEYDGNDNLTKITDMGGYWASFDYDADIFITKIENVKGKWEFYTEPADGIMGNSDNYPPPGDIMWENYRITATNPMGDVEEYFYYGGSGYSWYIAPKNYIKWESQTVNTFRVSVPRTTFLIHRTYRPGSAMVGAIGQKTYPGGGYVNYGYDTNGNRTSIKDYDGNTVFYTYNGQGRITSLTDAKGIVTDYTYANNGVDLLSVQNGLGTITLTYNSTHDVTSITDRLGNTTSFQYNSYGQPVQGTDPLGVVTAYTHDAGNQLQQITTSGSVVQSFTYDASGRIDTATDADGLTLDYDYNNLNKVTKVTYPDTKFTSYTYSSCCPHAIDSVTDRAGRTTSYKHDIMKRISEMTDHGGRRTRYEYDRNGNMIRFIDTENNATVFEYDANNRQVKKTYADNKYETYSYYNTGLLKDMTGFRGITTTYAYDQNYNLETVTYSDATPGVTYGYDDYNRVTLRQDGTGDYVYTYDANSRLTDIDGPWNNDTITFQYNATGDLRTFTPQGGQAVTYSYDYDPQHSGDISLGRLKDIQTGGNAYTYNYTGTSPLIQDLVRPNGSITEYLYNDPLKRLTEITSKTSTQVIINKNTFTYNNLDMIDTETIETGSPLDSLTEGMKTYDYNSVNQMLSSTNPSETFAYDDNGNMTQGYTPAGYQFTAVYDAEDRIVSLIYNDGSSDYETRFFYSGDSMLAKIEKWDDTLLPGTMAKTDEIRIIRAGFLTVQERDDTNTVTREYTWGPNMGGGIGGLLNLREGGADYSYIYDGKGNVMALTDSAESVVASYRYDAFGILKKKVGALNQPFMFSTKRYDELTGLSYYGYRQYSPLLRRWITRDPLGEAGGMNLYGFVQNNPVNWVDPWGLKYAELYAGYGAITGATFAVGGSIVVDAATGGLNIFATPAEIAAGAALFGAIGYGIGTVIDFIDSGSTSYSKGKGERRWGRRGGDDPLWGKDIDELKDIERNDSDPEVRQRAKKIRKMKEKSKKCPNN